MVTAVSKESIRDARIFSKEKPPGRTRRALCLLYEDVLNGSAEVTLQQALHAAAMTGLVLGHLVNGVVDGV